MGNEGQQPPQPEQGTPGQQEYSGWQYDQDVPEAPSPSVLSPRLFQPQQPLQAAFPEPPSALYGTQNIPFAHQQPIQDMGTSLGYGQGMEYQYFDTPQPSQPMERLRKDRLQQLREERLRRQQQGTKANLNTLLAWRGKISQQLPGASIASKISIPGLRSIPPPSSRTLAPPPKQPSPFISLPVKPTDTVVPVRASTLSPLPHLVDDAEELTVNEYPLSSVAPAQDTGMMQRVQIGHATLILTVAFVASRLLGLLRTSMFAFVFGTSATSDAYLQAFLVPDLIFNIVAGGALSSAFIPVFTHYIIAERDERTAWHIASSALNLALAIVAGLALIAIIFARMLVPLYNPGIHDPHQLDLIAALTRIMLLQSVALGGGVIVTSVLNAQQDFKLPAIGTVLYNFGLIAGLLPGIFFAWHGQRNDQVAVYAATWGVVLGAVLQVAVQLPGLWKVKMQYARVFDWHHPGVIQIGRQMVPRIINAAMLYCTTFVDRSLILLLIGISGSLQINGLITQYYQAFQLVLLPLGIFGMAVSTAAFPTLSENVARGRLDLVRNTIVETLRTIIFMSIPSSLGLIILGLPVIQVLLQHGRYTLNDATSTAFPLGFFAVGLVGFAAVEILTRSFYAMRDSITPVVVSVSQFIFKILLSLILINFGVWGTQWGMGALAFSTSIAGLLEAGVLFWLLHKRVNGLHIHTVGRFTLRVLIAGGTMSVGLLLARVILDFILPTTHTETLGLPGTLLAFIKLLIELFVGLFIYIRSSRYLGIEELRPIKRILDRLKLSWV